MANVRDCVCVFVHVNSIYLLVSGGVSFCFSEVVQLCMCCSQGCRGRIALLLRRLQLPGQPLQLTCKPLAFCL